MSADLNRRLASLFGRGVLRHADVTAGLAMTQAEFWKGETRRVELPQGYGFAAALMPGAEIFGGFANGDRDAGVGLANDDRRYRLLDLKAGEVAIYGKAGRTAPFQWVKMTADPKDGTIKVKAARIELRAGENYVLIDSDPSIGMQKGTFTPTAELPLNPGGTPL